MANADRAVAGPQRRSHRVRSTACHDAVRAIIIARSRDLDALVSRVRQEVDPVGGGRALRAAARITPSPPYIRSNLDKRYIKVVSV